MSATGTEARVCEMIALRQAFGLNKYGVSVEANPLKAIQWLQHLREELADALVYAPPASGRDRQAGGRWQVTTEKTK